MGNCINNTSVSVRIVNDTDKDIRCQSDFCPECRMKNNYKTVFSFEVLLLWNRKVSICIRKNFVLEKMMDH